MGGPFLVAAVFMADHRGGSCALFLGPKPFWNRLGTVLELFLNRLRTVPKPCSNRAGIPGLAAGVLHGSSTVPEIGIPCLRVENNVPNGS